jgi:hypothetical protein
MVVYHEEHLAGLIRKCGGTNGNGSSVNKRLDLRTFYIQHHSINLTQLQIRRWNLILIEIPLQQVLIASLADSVGTIRSQQKPYAASLRTTGSDLGPTGRGRWDEIRYDNYRTGFI